MEHFITNKNGLSLYYIEEELPLTFFQIHLRGGSLYESKPGLSYIFSKILLKGPSDIPTDEFYNILESGGGDLEIDVGYHILSIKVVLKDDQEKILEKILRILNKARLDERILQWAKEETLTEIKEDMEDWQEEAIQHLRKSLFNGHPYGRTIYGEPENIDKIRLEDLIEWNRILMNKKNIVIAGAGPNSIDKFLKIIGNRIEILNNDETISVPSPPSPLTGKKRIERKWKRNESVVLMGFRGVPFNSPDRAPLDVLSGFLGGTILPGGWLHTELRNKGLAYFSHSLHQPGEVSGYFSLFATTRNSNIEKLESVMMEIVERVQKGEFNEEDIERGKEGALLSISLRNSHIPTKLEENSKYILLGLGDEYDKKLERSLINVNIEDVQRVVEKYFKSMRIVLLKP